RHGNERCSRTHDLLRRARRNPRKSSMDYSRSLAMRFSTASLDIFTMETLATSHGVAIITPSRALRNYVSHYWLSRDNDDLFHSAVPDGAVDIVLEVEGRDTRSWVYGTTTRAVEISLKQQAHYLGIRFRPGQSRHFIKAAAHELTNGRELTDGLLCFPFDAVSEDILDNGVGTLLNRLLGQHLARVQPARSQIDEVIDLIEADFGSRRVKEIAAYFGKSQRQFERIFLETVGVSAKQFSSIARFHHAAALITQGMALVDAAAHAAYTDQSHMSNDFRRLADVSPRRLFADTSIFCKTRA
ncbi:MAG: AraC family transcriptional regulator, partial [Gammaproteobacteria bacterium]